MIDRSIVTGTRLSFLHRACVPGVTLRLDREPVAVLTCARLRWREHSGITPGLNRTRTPPVTLSAAELSSLGRGKRTAIERTQPLVALAVRPFIQQGTRWICNIFSLLKPSKQSSRVLSILFRPSPFVAAAHVEQHAAKEIPNVGKAYRRIGNV